MADKVAPAQLDRVDAELDGGEVDDALDLITRLGPTRAAIGGERRAIGEGGAHAGIKRGDAVGPAEGARGQ